MLTVSDVVNTGAVLISRRLHAGEAIPPDLPSKLWAPLVVKGAVPGDMGGSASTLLLGEDGSTATVVVAVLPEACSRHNSPLRPHAMTALVAPPALAAASEPGGASIIVVLDDAAHAGGAACAIARAFPLFSRKKASGPTGTVRVRFWTREGPLPASVYPALQTAADGVRFAARLVDMPPEQLTTTAFTQEALETAKRLNAAGHTVTSRVIAGEHLRTGGYGGLWNVGKGAEEAPALVILSYVPPQPTKTVCLVGKARTG